MIGPTIVTAAATTPIAVEDVKANSYITGDTEDGLIDRMIQAAVSSLEEQAGVALQTQALEVALEAWPDGTAIVLPRYPLQSVESIKYTDKDGTETTWGSANYVADTRSEPGRVLLAYGASWPSAVLQPGPSIVVRFVAGFGYLPDDVPAQMRQWLLREVADMYEHREHTIAQPGVTMAELSARRNGLYNARRR